MKKRTVRFICLLLALVTLTALAVSCGDKPGETVTTAAPVTAAPSGDVTDGEESTEVTYTLQIAPENNGGKEILILHHNGFDYDAASEQNGEAVNDAIFKRNTRVEDLLGIKFNWRMENGGWSTRNDYNALIAASAQSGSDSYDIVSGQLACSYVVNATAGYFKDLSDYSDIIQYDAPWWLQNLIGEIGFNGRIFGTVGDLSLSTYKEITPIFFNSELIKAYNYDSPYDLVNSGDWTVEKMMTLAQGVAENRDSDNAISYKSDLVGYLQNSTAARGWLTALDQTIFEVDKDGDVTITEGPTEKLLNTFDWFYSLFSQETNIVSDSSGDIFKAFTDGRCMFVLGYLRTVDSSNFSDMADDWGIVPMPKYDTEQKDYINPLGTSVGVWFIMENASDDELCAKIFEAMSYYANKDVVSVYYDVSLGTRRARDPYVAQMLGIIRSSAKMTFAAFYNGAFSPAVWNCLQMDAAWRSPEKLGSNLASYWAANLPVWKSNLENLKTNLG